MAENGKEPENVPERAKAASDADEFVSDLENGIKMMIENELRKRESDIRKRLEKEINEKEAKMRERVDADMKRLEEELRRKSDAELRGREDDLKREMEKELRKREGDIKEYWEGETKKREEMRAKYVDDELKKAQSDLVKKLEDEYRKKEEELSDSFSNEVKRLEEERYKIIENEVKKREDALVVKFEMDLRKKEEEIKNRLELDYRKKEDDLTKKMESELKKEAEAIRYRLELDYKKREEDAKTRAEIEYRRREEELLKRMELEVKKVEEEVKNRIEVQYKKRMSEAGKDSLVSSKNRVPYPFTAIVGQERMKRAMILEAINPSINGVLLWGNKGVGKYTAIIGLAELLSEEGNVPKQAIEGYKPWYDDDRYLMGTLVTEPHSCEYIVDIVLNTSALGFMGTDSSVRGPLLMKNQRTEDEDAALQIISRMALHVEVKGLDDVEQRIEIVKRMKDFSNDPDKFRLKFKPEEDKLRERILNAQDMLAKVTISNQLIENITRMCMFNKEGHKTDILIEELARTNAAYDNRDHVTIEDVMEGSDMVLSHRFDKNNLVKGGQKKGASERGERELEKDFVRAR